MPKKLTVQKKKLASLKVKVKEAGDLVVCVDKDGKKKCADDQYCDVSTGKCYAGKKGGGLRGEDARRKASGVSKKDFVVNEQYKIFGDKDAVSKLLGSVGQIKVSSEKESATLKSFQKELAEAGKSSSEESKSSSESSEESSSEEEGGCLPYSKGYGGETCGDGFCDMATNKCVNTTKNGTHIAVIPKAEDIPGVKDTRDIGLSFSPKHLVKYPRILGDENVDTELDKHGYKSLRFNKEDFLDIYKAYGKNVPASKLKSTRNRKKPSHKSCADNPEICGKVSCNLDTGYCDPDVYDKSEVVSSGGKEVRIFGSKEKMKDFKKSSSKSTLSKEEKHQYEVLTMVPNLRLRTRDDNDLEADEVPLTEENFGAIKGEKLIAVSHKQRGYCLVLSQEAIDVYDEDAFENEFLIRPVKYFVNYMDKASAGKMIRGEHIDTLIKLDFYKDIDIPHSQPWYKIINVVNQNEAFDFFFAVKKSVEERSKKDYDSLLFVEAKIFMYKPDTLKSEDTAVYAFPFYAYMMNEYIKKSENKKLNQYTNNLAEWKKRMRKLRTGLGKGYGLPNEKKSEGEESEEESTEKSSEEEKKSEEESTEKSEEDITVGEESEESEKKSTEESETKSSEESTTESEKKSPAPSVSLDTSKIETAKVVSEEQMEKGLKALTKTPGKLSPAEQEAIKSMKDAFKTCLGGLKNVK